MRRPVGEGGDLLETEPLYNSARKWHNVPTPNINYPRVINESEADREKLERRHRYTHLFHRVRMLRLLKSGECSNLGEAAEALGYQHPAYPCPYAGGEMAYFPTQATKVG
jgi:hypothetical protein